ncbi:MAG: protein YgfX [Methylococcaceae bacterium]
METWILKRSPQLFFLLILAHALALTGCLLANIPVLLQGLVSVLIFGSLIYYLKQGLWQAESTSLMFSKAAGFQLKIDDQFYSQTTIVHTTVITPWVVIVRIKPLQHKIITLIIFNDGIKQQGGYQGLCRQLILNS